jgi:hypothetical protein
MLELNEKQIARMNEIKQSAKSFNDLLVEAHKEGIEVSIHGHSANLETPDDSACIEISCRLTDCG